MTDDLHRPAEEPPGPESFPLAALADEPRGSTDQPDPGPRLLLAVAGTARTLAPGRSCVIGRGTEADVDVPDPSVSRRHAAVRYGEGHWAIVDLGSTNGIWHVGERVRQLPIETGPVTVRLGGPDGIALALTPLSARGHDVPPPTSPPTPPPTPPPTSSSAGPNGTGSPVRIGRSPSNTLVLQDLLVSRQHAEVTTTPNGPELRDLASGNGTFVNGRAIDRRLLRRGDLVAIGPYTLRFDGADLIKLDQSDGVELAAARLCVDVDGGRRILDDVSFSIPPHTLMAVVGPSGAGKSTLITAVAGLDHASRGTVLYGGRNLYDAYDELRHRIGFVPQQDLLHHVLTVRQALGFAARLRFPTETSAAERDSRVREVAEELSLGDRLDTRIASLSGGERKRASVAMEMLTKPPLLFFDEPTSGLDVDLDREVMRQLRTLADDGRTVVVVTHHLENLNQCDVVMVLASGGQVAFLGPPAEVFSYFGVTSWADLFSALKTRSSKDWAARFRRSPGRDPRSLPPDVDGPSRSAVDATPPPRQAAMRHWATLLRRQLTVTAADHALLAILVLTPVVLALIARVIPAPQGLARVADNREAAQLLLVLAVGAALTGAAGTVRELAKERALYRRERAVGLSAGAYLASKVAVFTTIGALQGATLTALALVGRPPPAQALVLGAPAVEIAVVVAAMTAVSAVFGLALSAAVGDESQAMPLLVLLTMAQLVMCGGLVPIDGRPGLEQLSWLLPSRWGFAATASTVDLRFLRGEPDGDALWAPLAGTWWLDVGLLLGLGMLAIAVTAVLLRRRVDSSR